MSTTNLITKSLGDILTESGNGVPDHVSPSGSLYSDMDSGSLYQNTDGNTMWVKLQSVAYGEGSYQINTTPTTINSTNTWVAAGNNFTGGTDSIGISASTDTLVILSGYDGTYEVRGDITLSYVAGTNNYEAGLGVNGLIPTSGTYGGCVISSVFTRQHIGFQTIVELVGGDTLEIGVRNITNTDNVIVRHAQLFARKVS
jgi:hypothetical protein